MKSLLERIVIEGTSIIAILGLLASIYFKLFKSEAFSNHTSNIINLSRQFPIPLASILLIVCIAFGIWSWKKANKEVNNFFKSLEYFRLILWSGMASILSIVLLDAVFGN